MIEPWDVEFVILEVEQLSALGSDTVQRVTVAVGWVAEPGRVYWP